MNRILIIQTASIGDVILATPVLEKLHRFYPQAAIDLLVKKGMEGLFRGHPFLNDLLAWDKSRKYGDYVRAFREVRKKKYDAVVNIQRFALTGLLTGLSGSSIRIGFDKSPFSFLFTKKVKHEIKKGVHEVNRNLRLIESMTDGSFFKPRLYPSAPDARATEQYKKGKYITVSPASLWYTKQFPEEKWVEFLNELTPRPPLKRREGEESFSHNETGFQVYFLGSLDDTPLCERIIRASGNPGCINLAGKLSFLESASLMKDAVMNYTNDSAPMHLASAVNAPVTVVYCSTIPGFGFGPLSDRSFVIETEEELSCRPCGLHGYKSCPETHFNCARTIDLSRLFTF